MKKLKSLVIFFAFIVIISVAYVIFSSFFEPGVYNLMVRSFVASHKGSDGIVLVVIDDESIERYRWPWSRDLYAKIFDYLGHYTNAKINSIDLKKNNGKLWCSTPNNEGTASYALDFKTVISASTQRQQAFAFPVRCVREGAYVRENYIAD